VHQQHLSENQISDLCVLRSFPSVEWNVGEDFNIVEWAGNCGRGIGSVRPIILLTIAYKIMAKALALRIQLVA